jgi:hypothetical protein
MFQETIGDSVLLVVPNRYRAFIFPRLASRYEEYTPMVFEAYRATAYPVSVEVFEVSADGMRAIGVYEEPSSQARALPWIVKAGLPRPLRIHSGEIPRLGLLCKTPGRPTESL